MNDWDAVRLAETYPVLYHMSAAGSWPGIRRHGLLSTSSLLDLFEIRGAERRRIEAALRTECIEIRHPVHGAAVIRDQRSMSRRGLERSLVGGLGVSTWLRTLNSKVFFWVTRRRLDTLRNARSYRGLAQTLIEVDTCELLTRHAARVRLAPINTGATRFSAPRGRDTFRRMADHPFEERRRCGREPVVELCVEGAVPDISDLVLRVTEARPGRPDRTLWRRSAP
ncbi:MAG: hypothetical protein QNK03_26810 [Myxococcota bacterium]|nr:hypothetical protein [Myxococcota bacterium]